MSRKIILLFLTLGLTTGCEQINDTQSIIQPQTQKSTTTVIENYFKNQINAVNKAKEVTKKLEESQNNHFNVSIEEGK